MRAGNSSSNIARLRSTQTFDRRMLMWRRTVKYGVSNFKRNVWLSLTAILVMTFTLLLVFIVSAATISLNDTAAIEKTDKMDLSLYLRSDTTENIQNSLKTDLENDPNVVYVNIVPKSQSDEDLKNKIDLDSDILELINEGGSSLADELPVVAQIHVKDVGNIGSIIKIVNGDGSQYKAFLDERLYNNQFFHDDNQKLVQDMTSIVNVVQIVALTLCGVFLLITVLVIFNTVSMAIFSRKDEIEMEKLIGAEKSYIRGPFLVEAELDGVISGLIAVGIGYGLLVWLVPAILTGGEFFGFSLALLHTILIGWLPLVVVVMLVLGIIIGNISARLAIRKYLRYG